MPLQKYDKLNDKQRAEIQLLMMENKEYFSVYPVDAEDRVDYCNELEDMLYEYFQDCYAKKRKLNSEKLFGIYILWLMFVANKEFGNNGLFEWERTYKVNAEDLADKFAEVIMKSRESLRFNELSANQDIDSEYEEDIEEDNTQDEDGNMPYSLAMLLLARPRIIARNETDSISNRMIHEKAKKLFKYHIWVTEEDNKVRRTHREVNRTQLPINTPFTVNGYQMLYPHDDSLGAGPEEIINCRCHEEFTNNEN